jgi:hypothetical protein
LAGTFIFYAGIMEHKKINMLENNCSKPDVDLPSKSSAMQYLISIFNSKLLQMVTAAFKN